MTPCLAAGCLLMFSYNSVTCLVHSVKYLFTFPFSCPGEVFLSPQGFLVCSLKKAKQHYLLVFLFLRFARRKDKNEGHLFWNWNFTHINKSDPINNNLQLTQLTLQLLQSKEVLFMTIVKTMWHHTTQKGTCLVIHICLMLSIIFNLLIFI